MDLSSFIILVPTDLERRRLISIGGVALNSATIKLCGFGPIAAGIATTKLLLSGGFKEVLLCGIGGSYHESGIEVGQAIRASNVMLDGVGVEHEGGIKSGLRLGFQPSLPDEIDLRFPLGQPGDGEQRALFSGNSFAVSLPAVPMLTVCIASGDLQQSADRSRIYRASVEDMEGFAVAAACKSLNVPLTILRGISNVAGDRDKSRWRIDAAMEAVAKPILERVNQLQ